MKQRLSYTRTTPFSFYPTNINIPHALVLLSFLPFSYLLRPTFRRMNATQRSSLDVYIRVIDYESIIVHRKIAPCRFEQLSLYAWT